MHGVDATVVAAVAKQIGLKKFIVFSFYVTYVHKKRKFVKKTVCIIYMTFCVFISCSQNLEVVS
jgi:hypothetical protein